MSALREQEEALFDAVLRLEGDALRQAFLDQACAGKPELRARLDALLEAYARSDDFFEEVELPRGDAKAADPAQGPVTPGMGGAEAPITEGPGTRIGRYKLLQRIGEGGCGVVYMAEQEKPVRRRVALKIIKLGMDTRSVIARFEAERQALAMMDHPNIARVLDAGATLTGRPYFVMELVRGVRITEYCDQNQLDTVQRLHLFIQVCHAIQHAHQKGIIHRDIKPSNILVTLHDGVPVPKVIDFGIAKATEAKLTEKTLFTAYEQMIGTPAYMSPEQAEMSGLDIDTRADIYSLGVLLYELLTGRTPFDPAQLVQSGLDEMRRTLREREPCRPSTMVTTLQGEELTMTARRRHAEPPRLVSLLRGDLDWIVLKALEKDRSRRYETANALAEDIRRYLQNEPVQARPPSRWYRLQKLVRRNKAVFAAGAGIVAALAAGFGTSTYLFIRERAAHQRALEAERKQAELRRQAEDRERVTQAISMVSQGRFDDAYALISQVQLSEPTVEGAAVYRAVGEWHALDGRWSQAADCFLRLLRINQLDGADVLTLDYLGCGTALIEAGRIEEYERFRHDAIAGFADAARPFADRIIKISVVLPADDRILKSLDAWTDVAVKSFSPEEEGEGDVFRAAWRSVSMALIEFRRGNYVRSVEWARRCLEYPEYNAPRSATAHVILSMALHRLAHAADARAELAIAKELIEARFSNGLTRGTGVQGFWFDWVFARILLREATALF